MQGKAKGFTFIEILVVVTIISLLATAGIVMYRGAIQNARDQRRMADIEQIRSAIELYRSDHKENSYPGSANITVGCGTGNSVTYGGNTYLSEIPIDPKCDDYSYAYEAHTSSGDNCSDNALSPCSTYILGVRLEEGGDDCTSGISCGTNDCNYCVGPYGREL